MSFASLDAVAVTKTTVSPYCTNAEPLACFANSPVSIDNVRPASSIWNRFIPCLLFNSLSLKIFIVVIIHEKRGKYNLMTFPYSIPKNCLIYVKDTGK